MRLPEEAGGGWLALCDEGKGPEKVTPSVWLESWGADGAVL